MELHNSVMGLNVHSDLKSSMNNYALQINYMKLRDNGIVSHLTFNIFMWLHTTSKYICSGMDILNQ